MEYRIVYTHNPNRNSEIKNGLENAQKRAEIVNEPAAILNEHGEQVMFYFGPYVGWKYVH